MEDVLDAIMLYIDKKRALDDARKAADNPEAAYFMSDEIQAVDEARASAQSAIEKMIATEVRIAVQAHAIHARIYTE